MFFHLQKYQIDFRMIWKGFNSVTSYPNDQSKFYEVRLAGIQALLACLSKTLYVQDHPNAGLLAILSLPYYPELLVSILAFVYYPEEKNILFKNYLVNKSSVEYNLQR